MKRFLLLACASALLPGSELVVRDLHVGLGTTATGFDYTVHGATIDHSGQDAWQAGAALEGGGRWSFARAGDALGLVVGADVAAETMRHSGGGLTTLWGRLAAGVGWAAADRWTMVAEAGALAGLSTLRQPASATAPEYQARGGATGVDLRWTSTWMLSRRFGVGAQAGWQIVDHRLEGDGLEVTLKRSGWIVALDLVWRFSNAPPRI